MTTHITHGVEPFIVSASGNRRRSLIFGSACGPSMENKMEIEIASASFADLLYRFEIHFARKILCEKFFWEYVFK
jgi:hypothetical protein